MKTLITDTFENIPASAILEIAKGIQAKILADKNLIELKGPDDFVTEADRTIQELILDYFENSALAGLYNIKAEETLTAKHREANVLTKKYLLIIDPIDGTNPFCRGEQTWGSMVGFFDREQKVLIYSWNLISNGQIYSSTSAQTNKINFAALKENKTFDIYDYRYGEAAKLFPQKLEELSLGKYKAQQVEVSSFPSSVWAGSELFKGNLSGLLWLSAGKGYHPDYDLIFVGALKEQGWEVLLGKNQGLVQMLAVAESKQELELLKQIGLSLTKKHELVFEVGTGITE